MKSMFTPSIWRGCRDLNPDKTALEAAWLALLTPPANYDLLKFRLCSNNAAQSTVHEYGLISLDEFGL